MKLRLVREHEVDNAMQIIDGAKQHLKQQGIDQWQAGYPDYDCIRQDIEGERGFLSLRRMKYSDTSVLIMMVSLPIAI